MTRLKAIWRDRAGATLVEFALVAPVFLVFLMGMFDAGYQLYIKSMLSGEMSRAARSSGLETSTDATKQAALDDRVRSAMRRFSASSNVTFTRTAYHSYARAQSKAEIFSDGNGNGKCDNSEVFQDENHNGQWDADAGFTGQGSAQDAVIYSAQIQYPRIFPVAGLIGLGSEATVTAKTVLRNQPYGEQTAPASATCPPGVTP